MRMEFCLAVVRKVWEGSADLLLSSTFDVTYGVEKWIDIRTMVTELRMTVSDELKRCRTLS
jgi:hypothetical protein